MMKLHNAPKRIAGQAGLGCTILCCMAAPVFAQGEAPNLPPSPANPASASLKPELLSRGELSAEAYSFKQRVYQLHVERGEKLGRQRIFDLPPAELALVPGTGVKMQKTAAAALGQLLAAARLDLERDLNAPPGDVKTEERRARALRVQALGINNAYRPASLQFAIWDRNFQRYYQDTAEKRRQCLGGEHGAAAAELLREYIGVRVAAPGFSNHQGGIAVDFELLLKPVAAQNATESKLSASMAQTDRWKDSWFWRWLVSRAHEFGFVPYEPEPWHWEYKPDEASKKIKPE